MRRFALGILAGSLLTIAAMGVAGGWYEYRMLDSRDDAAAFINNNGWHIVPNQPNGLYLERPRLRLH